MALATPFDQQLIEQARRLATLDRRRPSQANLRRAVSAAYYALFHCLVIDVCKELLGGQSASKPLRSVMARTFQHGEMADASKAFSRAHTRSFGELPDGLQRCIPARSIHAGVANICRAFVELQEARHTADYDLSRDLRRHDALGLVQVAESAIAGWRTAAAEPSGQAFRISLLLWRKVRRD